MEEQKEPSTSTTSQGGGGGRGECVVEEGADDKQQLSPAAIVADDNHERKQMEKDRLNQDLALSNDLVVRDRRVRPHMNFFDLKETTTTSPTSSQGRTSGGEVSGQRKRSAGVQPVDEVDDDDEERQMKMAYLTRAVFSNSLITSRIWPHLNFADLKVTREVSWDFFDKITSFRRFKNSAILVVTKESLEVPGLFDKNSSMTETWLGIQIEVDLPLEVLDKIRHILEHVQFVSLLTSRFKFDTDESDDELRDESYAKFIAGVLRSTPKLTCLQMDIRFLDNNLRPVWSSPTIRHHLKNLDSLEFPHFGSRNHSKVYGTSTSVWQTNLRDSEFTRNLAQLETVLRENGPRLKTLCFSSSLEDSTGPLERDQAPPITTSFVGLFQSHRGSLVKVSIPLDVWKSSHNELRSVILPQLKSLTTTVSSDDTLNFKSFLTNHPKLEELDVCIDDHGGNSLDNDQEIRLWEAIKRRCLATDTLKKVYLNVSRFFFLISAGDDEWGFLEGMKSLEEFHFGTWYNDDHLPCFTQGRCGSGFRLLENLPRNQKLERLSLNGMGVGCNFWNFASTDPQDEERENLDIVTEVPSKLQYLRGFQNLKRLSFRHSPNALDDEIIQFIFREMTALEELEVSHCPRLTDLGICGTGPEEGKRVSIQSLKDLKVLSIRACPLVTPVGLLSVLALPFLQSFDYFSSSPVPKSFVHGIAGRNPSLETISVRTFFSGDSSEDPARPNPSSLDMDNSMVDLAWSIEDKKSFFKKYPRIKALNNLEYLKRDREYVWWT